MRVIPPLTMTDARLTSSTVAEPDTGEAVYVGATVYALDAVVISTTTHRKYKSLAAGNSGNALTDTTKWQDIGPTNKWAMFDLLRNTATTKASPLTVVITPGIRVDSLAVMGIAAQSAVITMTSGGVMVYSKTVNLNTREVLGFKDFCFAPFTTQPSLVLFDLPPYTNGVITITLTSTTGPVSCGAVAFGSYIYIGEIQHGAEDDGLNFSKIERLFDGTATLLPRRAVPKTNQTVIVDKDRVKKVRDLRLLLNAVPAVWSGLDDAADGYFESFLILGIYKRFSINAASDEQATINLELEEI